MPKVLCTLPHASTLINGVAFEAVPAGMLSVDDLPEHVAAMFDDIPGYELVTPPPAKAAAALPPPVAPKPVGRPPKQESASVPPVAAPVPSGGEAPVSH